MCVVKQMMSELEHGETVSVQYERVHGSGTYTLTATVRGVTEVMDGYYEIAIRGERKGRRYVVMVSKHGVSVRTDYPNPDDNQQLGTNASITLD